MISAIIVIIIALLISCTAIKILGLVNTAGKSIRCKIIHFASKPF